LSWILDYDCPIDAKNTASDTALSIALKENNHELVELLLQRNANYEVTNSTEALLSLNIPSIASQLKRTNTIAEYNHIIPLKRFPGKRYCYLSWNIKSQVALKDKFKSIPNACMTISVYNTRKQVIETSYVIESPKYHDETHILWSSMWHMQTPLENIEPGSFILLEVKSSDMKESKLFGYYPIDKDTINSCEYALDVYKSTVNLDNIVAHKPPDKSLVEYALQLDFLILRENRIEPIEKLMCEYDATSSMSSKRK
jgi:ankyrin repeat protein